MSCSVRLYAKTNDQIIVLSDLNYEIPLSHLLLVSANTTAVDQDQCAYAQSTQQQAIGALQGDFELGYQQVFNFLQQCLQNNILDKDTYDQLARDTHDALDKFLGQNAKVYLEVVSDGANEVGDDEDMCSLIHSEITTTVQNLDDIIKQLDSLIKESGTDDLLKAIGFQWA